MNESFLSRLRLLGWLLFWVGVVVYYVLAVWFLLRLWGVV